MPLQPGEVSLLTLFADVHYYFGSPAAKPLHHRFDKSSYVYLYHDAINKRGRLEIANHAGTADQDAFTGFLDGSHVEYSHKHPTLFTITVTSRAQMNGTAQSPQQDTSQWHLPTHDLRNETKYMYKIHTIDLYFWTTDDATLFLDSLKRCLQPQQIRVLDASAVHSEHRDSMSPVVQRLEKAAISTPQAAERSTSVSTAQSSTVPRSNHTPVSPITTPPVGATDAPPSYAPMAYNPAAPAAPEPIAHREKTPPPADAAAGTGLSAVAMHEHGAGGYGPQPGGLQHQGSFPMQSQQPYMPGPPGQMPPPPQQVQRTNTNSSFPPPPPQQQTPYSSSIPLNYQQHPSSPPAHQQSFSPQPATQYANYNPQAPSYTPGPSTPGYGQTMPSPGFAPPQHQPQVPIGGYSTYNYTQQATPGAQQELYSVHQQAYRPTEAEASSHGHGHGKAGQPAQAGPGQQGGKFEARMDRVEKGVGRFLKRLDKKL
ncbi:hypothetical protein NA57DRAFT_32399 [Rhizodiscina lignyota]|uniref:RNA recognition motif-containing protein n=1 Tax=Rhizodiscina lignyota TaxID=1504668 RepID=A0A9P4INL9_9PEZI|nr:hypothetical protein NA57DRAFT_32399 [Rhizodiscina lignyota]